MKMPGVLCIWIARGEVHASAEPGGITFFEIPEISVNSRYHRILGMEDERDTSRKKFSAAAHRNLCGERFRKVAVHGREVNACFLKDVSILEDSCSSAATTFTRPVVFTKSISVALLDGDRDFVLQAFEVRFRLLSPHQSG